MSLALYRKYRPGTFAEVKGQEHVTEPLRQALRSGRIHHAYLFSGPRGCGKTSSARILARSLNCEKGPTPDPCGECESCVALAPTGPGHLDVIEIDAASHGGVDDARDLRERAFFAPVSARYKIYIIDEAHMVTREGFNALLKLVEEPPPHLKFVFATTEPDKVIGTIKSRTHHYPFRLIPPSTLRQLMEEILQAEGVPYEPAALPLAIRAGAGSARDTLSILDQLLAGSDESGITYQRAVSLLGYTDSDLLDEIVQAQYRNLEALRNQSTQDIAAAARLLHRAKVIRVAGFRACFPIAFAFQYVCRLFRGAVDLIRGEAGTLEMELRGLSPDDAVLAISFAPYSQEALRTVDAAANAGCPVVALTDSSLSPLALRADRSILFSVDSPSFFPSIAAGILAAEALAQQLLTLAGKDAVKTLEEAEGQLTSMGAYATPAPETIKPARRIRRMGKPRAGQADGNR